MKISEEKRISLQVEGIVIEMNPRDRSSQSKTDDAATRDIVSKMYTSNAFSSKGIVKW